MRSPCWRRTALTALSVAVIARVMPAASQPPPTAARARSPSGWHANTAATTMFLGPPGHEHRCGTVVHGGSASRAPPSRVCLSVRRQATPDGGCPAAGPVGMISGPPAPRGYFSNPFANRPARKLALDRGTLFVVGPGRRCGGKVPGASLGKNMRWSWHRRVGPASRPGMVLALFAAGIVVVGLVAVLLVRAILPGNAASTVATRPGPVRGAYSAT